MFASIHQHLVTLTRRAFRTLSIFLIFHTALQLLGVADGIYTGFLPYYFVSLVFSFLQIIIAATFCGQVCRFSIGFFVVYLHLSERSFYSLFLPWLSVFSSSLNKVVVFLISRSLRMFVLIADFSQNIFTYYFQFVHKLLSLFHQISSLPIFIALK